MYLFPECLIIGIIQLVAFSCSFLLINNMHLRIFLAFLWFDSSFLNSAVYSPWSGCTSVYLSTHLLKDILVASEFGQAIMNRAAHSCARLFVDLSFLLLWKIIRNTITWSYSKICLVYKKCQTLLKHGCTISQPQQQQTRGSIIYHPSQDLVFQSWSF